MQLPMRRWLPAALAGVLLLLGLSIFLLWRLQAEAAALPDYGPAPTFTLLDQSGERFSSDQLAGRTAVVGFIYTHCPDVCPMLTARMAQLQERLRADGLLGERAVLLSITVDPERDTPDVLARYAGQFGADTGVWRFLTGDPEAVRQTVADGFRVGLTREAAGGHGAHSAGQSDYIVSHSGRIVLVDPGGRIRAYYDGETLDLEQVVADVRSLE